MEFEDYPPEVQRCIDFLSEYNVNEYLDSFHIIHLYPMEIAYPNGYYDSRFFEVVGYNTSTMERKDIGKTDGIRFEGTQTICPDMVRIFADGSTLIRFSKPVSFYGASVVYIKNW